MVRLTPDDGDEAQAALFVFSVDPDGAVTHLGMCRPSMEVALLQGFTESLVASGTDTTPAEVLEDLVRRDVVAAALLEFDDDRTP